VTLILPETVAAVPQSQAASMIKRDEQAIAKQDTKVIAFIHTVLTLDAHTTQLRRK
jgi:hypothetical protein